MARNLTCPHCERTWDLDDERFADYRGDDIYSDHLRLFCRGVPESGATGLSSTSNSTTNSNSGSTNSSRSRKMEAVSAS